MPAAQVTIDGLWRCLCPSVDAGLLAKATGLREPFRPRPLRGFRPPRAPPGPSLQQPRALHQTSRRRRDDGGGTEPPAPRVRRVELVSGPRASLLVRAAPPYRKLKSAPTGMIYDALREFIGGMRGTAECGSAAERVAVFVRHLVEDRGERPNTLMYEALVLANADTGGSAEAVKELLREMRESGMQWSPSVYHSALHALAVHPDYLTRNTVLAEMRERWVELGPEGAQSVAIGLLRDGQYELALGKLDEMVQEEQPVASWVYDIFVYVFGQAGFLDDALRIMHRRTSLAEPSDAPPSLWYFVLDECSKAMHHEGTKYAWARAVQPAMISPPDGIALNVVNCASRHGDPGLAMQAIQYISARGTKLGREHFEGLMESYAAADDIENALNVLCIMNNAGLVPDRASTRPVYLALKHSWSLVDPAVRALFNLKKKYDVPVAALNSVIEGALVHGELDKALELYRRVREVCNEGPDRTTFQHLLEACRRPETARFLLSEMEAFSIRRDTAIDAALVNIHSRHGDHAVALRHFVDMARGGERPEAREDTFDTPGNREMALALLERCLREGAEDSAWSVLEACKEGGMDLAAVSQRLAGQIDPGASAEQTSPDQAPAGPGTGDSARHYARLVSAAAS